MDRYLGAWWELFVDPWFAGEWGSACGADTNYPTSDPKRHEIQYSFVHAIAPWLRNKFLNLEFTCDQERKDGKCAVTFPYPFYLFNPFGEYNILKTDYDNYTIVYSCTTNWLLFGQAKSEIFWVMTRQREVPRQKQIEYWNEAAELMNEYRGDDFWKKEDIDNYIKQLYQEGKEKVDYCIYDRDYLQ